MVWRERLLTGLGHSRVTFIIVAGVAFCGCFSLVGFGVATRSLLYGTLCAAPLFFFGVTVPGLYARHLAPRGNARELFAAMTLIAAVGLTLYSLLRTASGIAAGGHPSPGHLELLLGVVLVGSPIMAALLLIMSKLDVS